MKNKNELTSRQWKLYEFLKETNGFETQEELLANYEQNIYNTVDFDKVGKYLYGYFGEEMLQTQWNNMTSARALRKDLKAIRENDVVQKILVGTKFAYTTEEATEHLNKTLNKILRQLKTYHKEKAKLEKHLQTRLVFNKEKEIINALNNE